MPTNHRSRYSHVSNEGISEAVTSHCSGTASASAMRASQNASKSSGSGVTPWYEPSASISSKVMVSPALETLPKRPRTKVACSDSPRLSSRSSSKERSTARSWPAELAFDLCSWPLGRSVRHSRRDGRAWHKVECEFRRPGGAGASFAPSVHLSRGLFEQATLCHAQPSRMITRPAWDAAVRVRHPAGAWCSRREDH